MYIPKTYTIERNKLVRLISPISTISQRKMQLLVALVITLTTQYNIHLYIKVAKDAMIKSSLHHGLFIELTPSTETVISYLT